MDETKEKKETICLFELPLNTKQQLFALDYMQTKNATKSYLAVYGEKDSQVAATNGCRLLKNAYIQQFIDRQLNLQLEAAKITPFRILSEMARIAFFDPRKMFDENGNLKQISDLDDETAAAISSFDFEMLFDGRGEQREHIGNVKKYKVFNKNQALENLAKIRNLLENKRDPDQQPTNQTVINVFNLPDNDLQALRDIWKRNFKTAEGIQDANIIEDKPKDLLNTETIDTSQ